MTTRHSTSLDPADSKTPQECVEEIALTHGSHALDLIDPGVYERGLSILRQLGVMQDHPSYERMLQVSALLTEFFETVYCHKDKEIV